MAKVLVSRPLPRPVLARLEKCHEVEVRQSNAPMGRGEMIAALKGYDAVLPTLGDAFSADVLDAAHPLRCQLLANFGVGFNHIDVDAARALEVAVTNTPGAVTDATADIAMTLILMCARRAGEGERLVRSGKWEGWHPTQMLGMHVSGRTLGVIGMGRIGQAIAHRCHYGFGMDVVFYNRSPKDAGVPAQQLDTIAEVAKAADILVVAVPGGAETKHLIGRETFKAMRDHAIFINIARGDVVDERALIAALETGMIAGAGLDVYEREPQVPVALRMLENAVLLPHLGTAALEVREAMGMMAVENILSFFAGDGLINPV